MHGRRHKEQLMQRIRLWTASLVSRVDSMVTRIENHESLAQSAIRDVRRSAARARVQLRRVRADGARIRERLETEANAEATWRERAAACAESDRDKALECLRRSRQAGRQKQELVHRLEEHEHVEKQLTADVGRVDERLSKLEDQRNLLTTRQSRAEALGCGREAQAPLGADVAEIVARWETQVAEREYLGDCVTSDADRFETDFDEADEKAELDAELAELLDARNREED
jgi:phage shock protein A